MAALFRIREALLEGPVERARAVGSWPNVRGATVAQRSWPERGNVDGPRAAACLGDVVIEEEALAAVRVRNRALLSGCRADKKRKHNSKEPSRNE